MGGTTGTGGDAETGEGGSGLRALSLGGLTSMWPETPKGVFNAGDPSAHLWFLGFAMSPSSWGNPGAVMGSVKVHVDRAATCTPWGRLRSPVGSHAKGA